MAKATISLQGSLQQQKMPKTRHNRGNERSKDLFGVQPDINSIEYVGQKGFGAIEEYLGAPIEPSLVINYALAFRALMLGGGR